MVISIYIWPYCFLSFLHRKKSKLCPLIIVSLLIICSNMLRWIGISHLNLGFDFFMGIYYSIINIIPFIIDDIFYNKISKWKNIFIFPLSVAFCEFIFSFSWFANHNIYAYAHRENNIFLQIISIFGCYFLSFIIALFSSLLDYSSIPERLYLLQKPSVFLHQLRFSNFFDISISYLIFPIKQFMYRRDSFHRPSIGSVLLSASHYINEACNRSCKKCSRQDDICSISGLRMIRLLRSRS